ncbi:MAG: molybdopterin molybdotransferase MoeA [Coriobacteriales bacterium]|nr:molybdopterin molybdotransferase MoeA [Coriobacteriales bacterium]
MGTRYTLDGMISVEEALSAVLDLVEHQPLELVELANSMGRVLARDVLSDLDIAPFAHSAMDGFALRCVDVNGPAPDASGPAPDAAAPLRVVGLLAAGSVFDGTLQPGEALRIMTGAPMPAGADAVVRIEDCAVIGEGPACPAGREVSVLTRPAPGDNVRPSGEEARAGDIIMRAGERIGLAAVGLLASTGNAVVEVYGRPRVTVLSTGSELVDATAVPGPGQIRDSNTPALCAAAADAGAFAVAMPLVPDTAEGLRAALEAAVRTSDFVVLSGGAAEGDFDYTGAVIREMGVVLFSKVNMRPGKAQTLGLVGGVPVFGLPGNPVAAAVGFELLVRPALRKMQGHTALERPRVTARLAADVTKRERRRMYLRGTCRRDEHGQLSAIPAQNQSSALYSVMHASNCLIVVPEGAAPLAAGEAVECVCVNLPEGEVL